MSLWKGATSKLGIIARANRLRDRRVRDNRRILGETFNQGIILTALNKTLNKPSRRDPTKPTKPAKPTRNRLIPLMPVVAFTPVTAEVAGS
ncbi:MAG TPA: hypothetical protein VOA88_20955, partial [Candidatus Dormibacteraeota bacterium]|nr:hypothetical protein [Candidatus Dormibacteraeota bacterium]